MDMSPNGSAIHVMVIKWCLKIVRETVGKNPSESGYQSGFAGVCGVIRGWVYSRQPA